MEINPDTNDVNVFRFCGEYFDTETGTVYLRARYYQASIGRFISRDSFAGSLGDPLSLNLYTYCANNPLFFIDPSGHSYATLPSGNRMSINSASDAKLLAERRKMLSESSSQIITTTASKSEITPITGGVVTQKTTTTYTTAKTKYESSQNKSTNSFSMLNNGLSWIDNHIISPAADGISIFGKAVYHSASFEFGLGFGVGAEGKAGKLNASALIVPIRDEFVLAADYGTSTTSIYSISADFAEIIGLGAEAKCSADNSNGDGYPWIMPGHEWEYQVGLFSKYEDYSLSNKEEPHYTLSIGGGIYLFIGGDISLSFDVDEFSERMGWK